MDFLNPLYPALLMTRIDWQRAARNGQLTEALHLFACRLAWLRHGDQRARGELIRALEDGDAEIRTIAASLLVDPINHQLPNSALPCG